MKKSILTIAIMMSAVSLASCSKTSGGGGQGGGGGDTPSTTSSLLTGSSVIIDGTGYSFMDGYKADEICHIEATADGKTKVLGLKGGETKITNGKTTVTVTVNYDINGITNGAQFGSRAALASEFLRQQSSDPEVKVVNDYTVGNKNTYFADAVISYFTFKFSNEEWKKDNATIDFQYAGNYFAEGKKPTVNVTEGAYATMNADSLGVTFNDQAVGQKITLNYKYKVGASDRTYSHIVTVGEGYNIHNDKEMKKYFNNVTISGNLYMVRNISAELEECQYVKWTDENGVEHKSPSNMDSNDNALKGSPYYRAKHEDWEPEVEEVTLIGNYYAVTSEKIPTHIAMSDAFKQKYGIKTPQAEGVGSGEAAKIANNQEGVFYLDTYSIEHDVAIFKDVKITSNGMRNVVGEEDITKGANSMTGIFNDESHIKIDNVILECGYAGLYSNHRNSYVSAEYVDIRDNWGAGINSFRGNQIKVYNSTIHDNGGPGVWVLNNSDAPTTLDLGSSTAINNLVTTNGAWLTAYNITAAGMLVSALDQTFGAQTPAMTPYASGNKFNFEILFQGESNLGADGHVNKNVTLDGFSSTQNPKRINDNTYPYYQMLQQIIANTQGAYVGALGMTDADIANNSFDYTGTLSNQLGLQYMTNGRMHLEIDASMPGAGEISAICSLYFKTV